MTYEIVIPVIIAFAISALLGPVVIPFLRKLKVGQTERKELESHLKKNGTPTMGGIMILASIIITSPSSWRRPHHLRYFAILR